MPRECLSPNPGAGRFQWGENCWRGWQCGVFDCGDLEQGRHNPKRNNVYFAKKQQEYRKRQKEKKIKDGRKCRSISFSLPKSKRRNG
jgi:hypothetical protein